MLSKFWRLSKGEWQSGERGEGKESAFANTPRESVRVIGDMNLHGNLVIGECGQSEM